MITVTGATGHLGRLVIEDLLARGVAAGDIVAAVRTPDKAGDLADRGVIVREADYTRPETLTTAFAGTDRLLLVSSDDIGLRVQQHLNAIDAAAKAGVRLVAYTSLLRADTSGMILAAEHVATEQALAESGLPHTLLRNGWYVENYTSMLSIALEHGALVRSTGQGRISGTARADYAGAAAAVLTGEGHAGAVYELAGDTAFTLTELATIVTDISGTTVTYQDLPPEQFAAMLVGVGVPDGIAKALADSDLAVKRGALYSDSTDLTRLLGRPTTTPTEVVRAALAS
ncbi:SDR family oxidoreductase [Streptomyces sp. TRM72054]|uniref:SDR family oxidoreductase n=1 Tax=Streptomyces sp. TRM72054 TaxID=2870562 RepID=UPI001C8B5E36|nr:SDR family oxidoreductase [Streptomyces sp. TRM72054]MBX9397248.1 SDR family oxidoreductase [Streptomyces sp. TRM72054]